MIKIQSASDIITNSSSESFIIVDNAFLDTIKTLLSSVDSHIFDNYEIGLDYRHPTDYNYFLELLRDESEYNYILSEDWENEIKEETGGSPQQFIAWLDNKEGNIEDLVKKYNVQDSDYEIDSNLADKFDDYMSNCLDSIDENYEGTLLYPSVYVKPINNGTDKKAKELHKAINDIIKLDSEVSLC